ncbi:hypothetical protein GG851_02565 [Bordetella petrii]|nr:hypothetical protein [Bordetella petrii]
MPPTPENALPFETPADLAAWLAEHHDSASELWVQIYKKGSRRRSVGWVDCVVEALVVGWIDGQKKPIDDESYLQRLTPRRPNSNWSKKNRDHAERLIAEGRMMAAGQRHVDAAKDDGRWTNAYAGSSQMTIPQDFLDALETIPAAKTFFETLDRRNRYTIYYRLQTAKLPATRAKRIKSMLEQLARGKLFH